MLLILVDGNDHSTSSQAFVLVVDTEEVGSGLQDMFHFQHVGACSPGRHDAQLAIGERAQLSDLSSGNSVIGRMEPDACATAHRHLLKSHVSVCLTAVS